MKQQRGISLIVVLIGMVVITFAAVALLRSTDTGTLLAGNLAFKKTALSSGDTGTEAGITWLQASFTGTTLHTDKTANAYYATSSDTCDMTGSRTPNTVADDVQWGAVDPGADCQMQGLLLSDTLPGLSAGYTVQIVINRMCNAAGNPNSVLSAAGTPMVCSRADAANNDGGNKSGHDYSHSAFTGGSVTYYRVTTRITGPRETVRYVQAFVVL
jgi:type IV pilus assembly protein PilX